MMWQRNDGAICTRFGLGRIHENSKILMFLNGRVGWEPENSKNVAQLTAVRKF